MLTARYACCKHCDHCSAGLCNPRGHAFKCAFPHCVSVKFAEESPW